MRFSLRGWTGCDSLLSPDTAMQASNTLAFTVNLAIQQLILCLGLYTQILTYQYRNHMETWVLAVELIPYDENDSSIR